MRLQRYLALCGVASRRKCEALIAAGRVRVNGAVADRPGTTVVHGADRVELDGRPVEPESETVCYMLHKESGVISTCSDPRGRPTVLSYFTGVKQRLYPVGRLDSDTEGLLLVTNDGMLAHRLTHPRFEVEKTYVAYLRGQIAGRQARMLERGVELDGARTAPARVEVLESETGRSTVRIVVREGRNRQVRRMFEAVGLQVFRLVRVQIGPLPLGTLKPGKYRKLGPHEVQRLLDEAAAGEFDIVK